MAAIAPILPVDIITKYFLPVLVTLSQDKVANIRMNVAKTISAILPQVKGQNKDLEVIFI